MLKTVKDACVLHETALQPSPLDLIENLHDLIEGEKNGAAFFEKNYVTQGMAQLFRQGLKRLAGQSDDAVFQLTQAMGGGKTHLMIAFGLLAKHPELRKKHFPELAEETDFGAAKVVAFSGRNYPDHYFWGEIAQQLGKPEVFTKFWANGARAPDEKAWMQLIGDEPVLILLDEMPPYFDNALTVEVGAATLANVATAALASPLCRRLESFRHLRKRVARFEPGDARRDR